MESLETLFQSFETGIRNGKAVKPKEYLRSIGLEYSDIRIGFNSGQFHHRKTLKTKEQFEKIGVITKSDAGVRDDSLTAYTVFGRYGVIFPLVNQDKSIVNYYALRFDLDEQKQEYLNSEGIYPAYPHPLTKKLYLAPTVIDCASLIQSKILDQREAVIALHDGELLEQHLEIIKSLYELEEIIIFKR